MTQFIVANNLSDDQVLELVQHGTVEVDGFLYSEWRRDAEQQTWLKRISGEIHGVEPDTDICADGFIDYDPSDDDDDDPIEFSIDYGSDDDE